MNTEAAPAWLPPLLVPFFTLSYPTARPADPDSFPDANYYGTGLLDGCVIVTAIAFMAVLRDVTRIYVFESFARWKLARDLRHAKRKKLALANGNGKANGHSNGKANGVANGNGHAAPEYVVTPAERRRMNRSVIRFAEQGWSVIYYTFNLCFGLVRRVLCVLSPLPRSASSVAVCGVVSKAGLWLIHCDAYATFVFCSTCTGTCPLRF